MQFETSRFDKTKFRTLILELILKKYWLMAKFKFNLANVLKMTVDEIRNMCD